MTRGERRRAFLKQLRAGNSALRYQQIRSDRRDAHERSALTDVLSSLGGHLYVRSAHRPPRPGCQRELPWRQESAHESIGAGRPAAPVAHKPYHTRPDSRERPLDGGMRALLEALEVTACSE